MCDVSSYVANISMLLEPIEDKISVGTSVVYHKETGKIRPSIKNEIPFGVITENSNIIINEKENKYTLTNDTKTDFYGLTFKEYVKMNKDSNIEYKLKKYNIVALIGEVIIIDECQKSPNWVKIKTLNNGTSLWLIR